MFILVVVQVLGRQQQKRFGLKLSCHVTWHILRTV